MAALAALKLSSMLANLLARTAFVKRICYLHGRNAGGGGGGGLARGGGGSGSGGSGSLARDGHPVDCDRHGHVWSLVIKRLGPIRNFRLDGISNLQTCCQRLRVGGVLPTAQSGSVLPTA